VFPDTPPSLDPPSFLTELAQAKYHEVAPMLHRNRLLTEADTDTLAVYCQTWARYVEAETRLQTEGATTRAASGYEQVSPWVTIAKNCRADLLKLGDRLGLNPSARGRIAVERPETRDELLA
jgi:P27 family predicted phage terminase small subunit